MINGFNILMTGLKNDKNLPFLWNCFGLGMSVPPRVADISEKSFRNCDP